LTKRVVKYPREEVVGELTYEFLIKKKVMKTGSAKVNGTKLYYEVMGGGCAVVLIHAGKLDGRMWDDQVKEFAKYFEIIRYDVRGYGKSEIPQKPYSDVEDLLCLLKFLNVGKACLIGLSMGGKIAIDFALEHPEMADVLIPVAPDLSGFVWSDEKIIRGYQIVEGNSHVFLLNPLLRRPLKPPAIKRLSEIRVPTLIIAGDRDVSDIIAIADVLEANINGAKKVVIPGSGHIVNMEKPEEFNRIVLDFLREQVR